MVSFNCHRAIGGRVVFKCMAWATTVIFSIFPVCADTFTVTSNADCTNCPGSGTLRQAMIEAGTNGVPDVIQFNIGGSGSQSINLLSALPQINEPLTIDATTQPGYTGYPLIELNGTNSGDSAGLRVAGGNCVIRGLVLNRFVGGGIRLQTLGNNVVEGCYIGVSANGTSLLANGQFGVWISSGSAGNRIGGTNTAQRNVISGNAKAGIYIQSSPTNTIQGNYIGLSADGLTALTNGNDGIVVDGSSAVTVGGSGPGQGNVISGNKDAGVYVLNSTAGRIQGNLIGLAPGGSTGMSNWADGIQIKGGSGHLVGGTNSGEGNVISGNGTAGVFLWGCSGVTVQGNLVGLKSNGTQALGNRKSGVVLLAASSNLIGGTVTGARNVISGNTEDGILLTNSIGNRLEGNWIGLDITGSSALANAYNGVTLQVSTNNTVGGTATNAGNVISGNMNNGVSLDAGSSGNTVCGNLIGLNAAGTAGRANLNIGVLVFGSSNIIGGATAAARNVISGNGQQGISVEHPAARGNVIQGNYIGTNPSGTAALGNWNAGIYVTNASATLIGGTIAGAGNLISGSGNNAGIYLAGSGTTATLIQGNYIGTSASGTSAIANRNEGVFVEKSGTNTIGGSAPSTGNLISGNRTKGIFLTNGASGNVIQGNRIGTKADSTNALANGSVGAHNIDIEIGCHDNRVGGTLPGEANRMGYAPSFNGNDYAGVRVRSGALRNAIRGNSIFTHTGLGVDLGTYRLTANDPCDGDGGANLQQNFPTLTKAAVSASGITIQGDLNSTVGNACEVDFFASPVADSSGYGEGEVYLGSTTVTVPGPGCSAHFVAGFVQTVPVGWKVSATATDPAGNTSEFCAVVAVEPYPALGIQMAAPGTSALLTWTNTATGYVLRMTDSLTPPITWSPVTNTVVPTSGQWVVTVPVEGVPARFYRLDLP